MTYYDAIKNLLKKIDDELDFPINIVFNNINSNYIDVEFEYGKRNLDDILYDKIPNSENLSIVWLDVHNDINFRSCNRLSKYSASELEINKYFKSYKHIGTTKNEKYNIYLFLLPDTIGYGKHGFLLKEDLVYEDFAYKFDDIILPFFNQFKYKNLYNYKKEKSFINAILIEFIVRSAMYNNLLPDLFSCGLESTASESEEEFDMRVELDFQNQIKKCNDTLIKYYGIGYDDITTLGMTLQRLDFDTLYKKDESILIEYRELSSKNIQVDVNMTETEVLNQFRNIQEEYKKELILGCNLKEMVNQDYLNRVCQVLEKFPKSFKKKQDAIIKALFIFDFIQAKKLYVDMNNQAIKDACKAEEIRINQLYDSKIKQKYIELKKCQNNSQRLKSIEHEIKILQKEQRQELKEFKDDSFHKPYKYPKMNTQYADSIFYVISKQLDEKVGQVKKLHSHIYKFLETKIP